MLPKVIAIVAMDEARVVGHEGAIPWHLPEDLKRFSKLTRGHLVVMGRKTFDSLPSAFRPLPNRTNVVVSRNQISFQQANSSGSEVVFQSDPTEFLEKCRRGEFKVPGGLVWIAGGGEIYRLTMPFWDEVQMTLVEGQHRGDTFFPAFESEFRINSEESGQKCRYLHYIRKTN